MKIRIPGKGLLQTLHIVMDAFFIIDVKWCTILLCYLSDQLIAEWDLFISHYISFFPSLLILSEKSMFYYNIRAWD